MHVTIRLMVSDVHPILEFTMEIENPLMLISSKTIVVHGHPMEPEKKFTTFHPYQDFAYINAKYYFGESHSTNDNITSIIEQLMNTGWRVAI
jgi:hypothetical protein